MVGSARLSSLSARAREAAVLVELVEIVHVDLSLSGLVLELCPCVCRPSECGLTENVRKRTESLFVSGCRIHLEHSVGKRTVVPADLFLVQSDCSRTREHGSFVRICSDEAVHVVVIAFCIHGVLVVRKYIPVNYRPEASYIGTLRISDPGLEIHRAKFGERRCTESLHELHAVCFCTLHVPDAVIVVAYAVHRAERSAAFADGTAEQTLCKR